VCGICGVIQIGGEPRQVLPSDVLDRMTDTMTHRGPNDRGTYVADGVALGVRRLSIVDVAGGHQPFGNETGRIWAVQNGELYNHGDLRRDLQADGHAFRSRCDTEVLPHLYERYGLSFPRRLQGMFGLAVWDEATRQGVVARDRLGIKPMYYAQVDDVVVFASELKGLLASGLVDAELDYEAIDLYLSFGFVPGPRTLLAGVFKLMPGHMLVAGLEGMRVDRYWSYPKPVYESPRLDDEDYGELLLEELEESVRLRLMSDVPLGAMLSGGLDSSLIVALMARNMSEPVKTFSIGFAEDDRGNELDDARFVAQTFATEHHELELSYTQDTIDLADLVWHLDEPIADLSALGFYAISELASRHVTVALSGQGADELLGGYKKHRAAALAAAWNRVLPRSVAVGTARLAARGPNRIRRAARTLAAREPVERLFAMSGRVDQSLRRQLYRGPLAELDGNGAARVLALLANGVEDDPLPATLFLDAQLALVDDMLHYFDRMSMAHSLEVRVPFLDHHVVEACARIPADLKVRRLTTTKAILKQAARGLVPDRIIDKRKLAFFRSASDGWLRSQIPGAVSDYLLEAHPRCGDFLDRKPLTQLLTSYGRGSGNEQEVRLLLAVLMLEVWLRSYLPRATAAPSAQTLGVTA
jgi:asparagine synthase (glutamine-hydrolysing)